MHQIKHYSERDSKAQYILETLRDALTIGPSLSGPSMSSPLLSSPAMSCPAISVTSWTVIDVDCATFAVSLTKLVSSSSTAFAEQGNRTYQTSPAVCTCTAHFAADRINP